MSHDLDYIQIQLASPKEIERWSQRVLPNNQIGRRNYKSGYD